MKKLLSLLLTLLITMTYSQVIINGEDAEPGAPLQDKDLDVRGNLKIDKVQPTIYQVSGTTTIIKKEDLRRLFLDKKKRFVSGANLIKKRFNRLVFYIKIDNSSSVNGYHIARFDTKIPYNQYEVVLGTCDLINSEPAKGYNGDYHINKPKDGYQAVEETNLFEDNGHWAFSVNYTSKTDVACYWRVTLYAINKLYTQLYNSASRPNTILFEQPNYEEIAEGVGVGTDSPTQTLEIAGNLRMNTPTTVISTTEIKKLMPVFLDKENILRTGSNEKIARIVRLKINMDGNDKDFLYDLRLGLDPSKYTPVLANYRFLCMDSDTSGFVMTLIDGNNQPVLNTRLSKTTKKGKTKEGPEDWALYMDYYAVRPKPVTSNGCKKTRWEATLLIFYNEYINDVVIKNSSTEVNDFEHPVKLRSANYDSSEEGYIGEIGEAPVLVNP